MTTAASWPAVGAHRLLGRGGSAALLTPDGTVDWWCAPRFDSEPLAWSLLDPRGGRSRWVGAEVVEATGCAGSELATVVRIGSRRFRLRDALVPIAGGVCLVRLIRLVEGRDRRAIDCRHELLLGGFDANAAAAGSDPPLQVLSLSDLRNGSLRTENGLVTIEACHDRWTGLAVAVGGSVPWTTLEELVRELDAGPGGSGGAHSVGASRATPLLPRRHPERALDALAVLEACTHPDTGAVVASVTTSLPEAVGGERQWDYRFTWLRDAALATSVASLLGRASAARRYLAYVTDVALPDPAGCPPLLTVDGGPVPEERVVTEVRGWHDSRPVRVGNAAAGQVQFDSWGFVVEAVSVHLQTGGRLDGQLWQLVEAVADQAAAEPPEHESGIWELRTTLPLLSADIGRWMVLDRAVWIARGWRPLARRRRWKRARREARDRVLDAILPDGLLPQAHGSDVPDAASLMAVVFGLIGRKDPRAGALVDRTVDALATGPFLRRYPSGTDGLDGDEGAFLPVCWWLVAALAVLGRVEEAEARLDDLCARLPRLLSEEVDPGSGHSLGNVPLVWSHAELARALYVVDAARLRRRFTVVGLWMWRLGRYLRLRWQTSRRR